MFYVLAAHADVVGDLVDVVAGFRARQDAGARPMDRRVVGVLGIDISSPDR